MKRLALHWQILLGMILGVLFAIVLIQFDWGKDIIIDWVKPFGNIFINLLKLIAVPLILASLIKGVSDLKDISKLSKMGGRTIGLYILTTIFAVSIGLVVVNIIKPGSYISEETRTELVGNYASDANSKIMAAEKQSEVGPLQALEDIVPSNIIKAASDNGNMLQVIFFAMFFGFSSRFLPAHQARPMINFFEAVNETFIKMVQLVMKAAPFFVFCLMAGVLTKKAGSAEELLQQLADLGYYSLVVVIGLLFALFVFYPTLMRVFGVKIPYGKFFREMSPAMILAFSSSSSAAALPVTIDCVENRLKVPKKITDLVLPIGATLNMDGTSLYQAVAVIFLAQYHDVDLTLIQQLGIIITATLASFGAAAVPGAGLIMLIMVLSSLGLNPMWIALISPVDRLLDMCRTVNNVVSDAVVAIIINRMEEKQVKVIPPEEY